jgi:hypothetical protein
MPIKVVFQLFQVARTLEPVNDGNLHAGFTARMVQSYNAAAHPRARS